MGRGCSRFSFLLSFAFLPSALPQMLESQVEVRQKEVEELRTQAQALSQEGKGSDEVDSLRRGVEKKFHELQEPLKKRQSNLMASREIHQFNRDVEDEIVSSQLHVVSNCSANVLGNCKPLRLDLG